MGWGLIGGAAVNAYNTQERLAQEKQLNAMRMAEEQRQIGMNTAADNAANGTGADTPQDPAQAPVQGAGLQMPQQAAPQAAPGPDAAPLDGSLQGNPDSTYVAQPTAPTAKSTPTMGTGIPTTPAAPRMSAQLASRAQALMQSGGGVKSLQLALATHEQSLKMAQQERDQDLMNIMRSPGSFEDKASQLASMIDGSAHVPGSASVQQGPDGSYYLQHTAPGKDKPFVMKLEGSNPQEVLSNLAMNVRGMTDSGLAMQYQQLQEVKRHNLRQDDYHDEANAWKSDAAAQKNAAYAQIADAKTMQAQYAGEVASLRAQNAGALLDFKRANAGDWKPYGQDKDGNLVMMDGTSGETKVIKNPPGVTPFNKVTGNKAGGQTHVLDDREKLAYSAALQELPPKATPADKLAIAAKYNLPPDLFGATPLPPPTALGAPPKAAAVPARGLQMAPNPQAETLKMNLDNAKNMLALQKPGSISYKLWQERYNGYQQQLSALQSK